MNPPRGGAQAGQAVVAANAVTGKITDRGERKSNIYSRSNFGDDLKCLWKRFHGEAIERRGENLYHRVEERRLLRTSANAKAVKSL